MNKFNQWKQKREIKNTNIILGMIITFFCGFLWGYLIYGM